MGKGLRRSAKQVKGRPTARTVPPKRLQARLSGLVRWKSRRIVNFPPPLHGVGQSQPHIRHPSPATLFAPPEQPPNRTLRQGVRRQPQQRQQHTRLEQRRPPCDCRHSQCLVVFAYERRPLGWARYLPSQRCWLVARGGVKSH
eukprot:scaffold215667_cov34-Tisochrysis_lutea.AAC.4